MAASRVILEVYNWLSYYILIVVYGRYYIKELKAQDLKDICRQRKLDVRFSGLFLSGFHAKLLLVILCKVGICKKELLSYTK